MNRHLTLACLLMLPVTALAVPPTLTSQGRLLDSTGIPINGASTVTFSIYDDADATNSALWSEAIAVELNDGY